MNRVVNAHGVKLDIRLSKIKPLHTKWMVDMFKFKKESIYLNISGFSNELISESATLINLWVNPFQEIELVVYKAL